MLYDHECNECFVVLGLVCYCTSGFADGELCKPVNTSYYEQECPGVCLVQQDKNSGDIIQSCANTHLYIIACRGNNYSTLDNGVSFCCVNDYCNSEENFRKFRARVSPVTTNNVGQGTSTSNLIGATSWIPTASPSGELCLYE